MNKNTAKYYGQLCLYYTSIVVRITALVIVKPVSIAFGTLDSVVSDWEPRKPLHTSDEYDPMTDPNNIGRY